MNFDAISPKTTEELRHVISENQGNPFRFGAGYSDLLLELKKHPADKVIIINLANLLDTHSNSQKTHSDFIKVGTRRSMECSVVSLAYHLLTDENHKIIQVGIAIGSVAPMIRFVKSACEFLVGMKFSTMSSPESKEFAEKVLTYAAPISDIRASAWYRKEVLFNISKSIFQC